MTDRDDDNLVGRKTVHHLIRKSLYQHTDQGRPTAQRSGPAAQRLNAKPRGAQVCQHVSLRRARAARRLQRFVRRLFAGDARFEVRRGFFARAPARLKNSMISAADFFANSSACASRMFLTISTARISTVCFTGHNLSRRIDRQGLIATFSRSIDSVETGSSSAPPSINSACTALTCSGACSTSAAVTDDKKPQS